jgi:hypothetical protein
MTAFVANNGLVNNFDQYSGGSVNATLDTYTISNGSTLKIRTDSNACTNHSVAFGSLDIVSFTGTGGTLEFDPTYVRVISYTLGSGNAPAFGTIITANNGTTGIFLGAWTNWSSECIVPGEAIAASGFIKLGAVSSVGNFNSGALTGIAATCSGADVQGWIEVRGPTTATITVPRIGRVISNEAWFELGVTNGSRGQILACPTCATNAGVFPGVWIETAPGSGVYDRFTGVGTQLALATTRTDSSCKFIWSTVTGIRIGNNGTNDAGFLPPSGCKVRIPATILTNCTRTAGGGSGVRVLPNATLATRQEFITTGAGYFDLRCVVSQWYMNFSQAFYVKYKSCAINDAMILSEIASPLDIDDCIVSPTQAQLNVALQGLSCFAGGGITNSNFWRFSLATSGSYATSLNYMSGVTFSNNIYGSLTLRANANTGVITSTQCIDCTFTSNTHIGGRGLFVSPQRCEFNSPIYYDHTITTTTTSTNPASILELTTGGSSNTINGCSIPLPANGPYTALYTVSACYDTFVKLIGSSSVTPLALNAAVTGIGVNSTGNNDGIIIKRMWLSNTRTGPWAFVNSDTNILIENSMGDYADTTVNPALNATVKNVGLTSATTGQVSTYGTHWITRFTSATAGFAEVLCNEPTTSTASQCYIVSGTPQFNSAGSVLLTKIGDSIVWEMPFFAIGYTAFTNSAPIITGTNVTFTSGSTWGNHTLEYQVDVGSGYGGVWKSLNAATLISDAFNSTTGFKLKIRATCLTAASTNVLTNLRVPLTTTSNDQRDQLYPLETVDITLTGLKPSSEVRVYTAATTSEITGTGVESSSTSHTFTVPINTSIDISILALGYQNRRLLNYTASSIASLPISQELDRQYQNI